MTAGPSSLSNTFDDTRDYSLMLPQLKQLNKTWIFSEEAVLEDSPTRQQRVPLAMELRLKESLIDFLIKLGTKLKLDSRSMLAATTYLHRFFMRVPISQSKYYVACAALLISCKLNDTYRQPDSIAKIACNMKAPPGSKPIDTTNEIYWKWKDQLLFREELMLRKLNFDLDLILPYNIREWIFKTYHNSDSFNEKKINILKMTTSLIEALSVLPLILCYEMNVIFGVCMIIAIVEGRRMEENKDLFLPDGLLRDYLNTDYETCLKCFHFIKKILKAGQEEPKYRSNTPMFDRMNKILIEQFEAVGKGSNKVDTKVDQNSTEKNDKEEEKKDTKEEEKKTSAGEAEKKSTTNETAKPEEDKQKEVSEQKEVNEQKETSETKDTNNSKPNGTEESIGDKRKLDESSEQGPESKIAKS